MYQPIPGSRIDPLPDLPSGGCPTKWLCPRCGRTVDNNGGHLIYRAPCRDCRSFLRQEYGDDTWWSRRARKPRTPPRLRVIDPEECGIPITVRTVTRSWWWELIA